MNLRDLSLRIRALAAPRRVERELHDELAFHLERETQKHVANGLSPAEARNLAMARFGPVVLSQSVRPVGFGLLAGGGLAAGLAIVLMSTPAASEIGNTVRVLDPTSDRDAQKRLRQGHRPTALFVRDRPSAPKRGSDSDR